MMEEDKALDLHTAARNGYIDIVKMLIENGADVNSRDDFDETALMIAVKKGHSFIITLLEKQTSYLNQFEKNKALK